MKHVIYLFLLFSFTTFAQTPEEDTSETYYKELRQSRIVRVRARLLKVKNEIQKKKEKIKKEKNSSIKLKYYEELEKLETEYLKNELTFISVSTDINLEEAFAPKDMSKTNLFDDVMEVIKPALDSVKRVSQRPRKIEELKTNIEDFEEKLANAKSAQEKLIAQKKKTKNKIARNVVESAEKRVSNLIEEIMLKLEDSKVKLHKLLTQDQSLFSGVKELAFKFFRTKGKNILLSMIVFFLVLWPLKRWRVFLLNLIRNYIYKYSVNPDQNNDWMMRPVAVLYTTGSFILASLFGLLTLYILNDWLLVTVFLLINSMVIWSLKDKIPLFIEQFKLYINFGPVREKERVVWKGIPWRVRKLGLYCSLENPFLQGADIRVHSSEMLKCQSRPCLKTEAWFPSRVGDWIELSDSTFGLVTNQNPEFVSIKLLGGAIKTIETVSFLALNPVNLSKGYRVSVEFGLDYGIQASITNNIINIVKEHFLKVHEADFLGGNPKFKSINVEFESAGPSSLNIRVDIDVNGQFAGDKLHIQRDINKELVNICNANNLVIPFNQLTVHMNG